MRTFIQRSIIAAMIAGFLVFPFNITDPSGRVVVAVSMLDLLRVVVGR